MATYFIKYPGGADRRQSFAILRREGRVSSKVTADRLDVINDRFAAGEDFEVCKRLVVELKDELRSKEKAPPLLINDNLRVVHRYLAGRSRTRLISPYAQERELIRAVEALGPLQLEHAPQRDLQAHLDRAFPEGREVMHARVVAGLNRLLIFLRKDFKLEGRVVFYPEPAHVTLDEFLRVLPKIEPLEHRLLLATLFATGARLGEAFAIRQVRPNDVHILKQLATNGAKQLVYRHGKTKSETGRNAAIIPELHAYVKEWSALADEKRRELRVLKWSVIARRWLGIRAHDLRHSYAKRLAEKRFTRLEIANNLGISELITERHYKGWIISDPLMEEYARRLKS